MNIIIWLIVGGVIGWLASLLMKTGGQGIVLNVVVGIVGAFIGGYLITPLIGGGNINQQDFSVGSLVVSFLGAALLLGVVSLLRRATAR
jgi:uncharacterized membrane protein YeaQ/YmgE (transglycosylase-associated protein family)